MRTGLALAAACLALAACDRASPPPAGNEAGAAPAATASAASPPATAAASGWVDHVEMTPDGGWRMGDPKAKARLVEYGSFTCPHCAAFAAEAMPEIKQLVASGRLSFEFRPYARDVFDLTAALVARCAGASGAFPVSEEIFSTQQTWIGNAQSMTPADQKKIDALPPSEQLRAVARGTGLNAYVGKAGVAPATLDRCLTDPAAVQAIVAVHETANKRYNLQGTPLFLLNDAVIGSADWAALKPRVEAAAR
ncbi:thioredoxin domain-containing protein [Sphingomonas morindae]|uniref:DsbA family protein n=1 Tax=Sphingomonas morindae TaxID=1541170 RepID=A0ABY4X5A1_9SPHN|nr:thioredoxin domain-containing protein [Sphingomonas morindae]USI72046.1 DsbA family protein [Sphingomonas morindae]